VKAPKRELNHPIKWRAGVRTASPLVRALGERRDGCGDRQRCDNG